MLGWEQSKSEKTKFSFGTQYMPQTAGVGIGFHFYLVNESESSKNSQS